MKGKIAKWLLSLIFISSGTSLYAQNAEEEVFRRIKVVPVSCDAGVQKEHEWLLGAINPLNEYYSTWRLYNLSDSAVQIARFFWGEPNFQPGYSVAPIPPGDSLDFSVEHLGYPYGNGSFHKSGVIHLTTMNQRFRKTIHLNYRGEWVMPDQQKN